MHLPKISAFSKKKKKEGEGGKEFPHAISLLYTKGFPVTLVCLLCQRTQEGAQSPPLGWHT